MLVVRGTKKLRDRVKGAPAGGDVSTTALGDWFATALFWRPQAALLVNQRTLLPAFVELAPAATLLDRVPAAIDAVLRRHGVDDAFLAAERDAMSEVRIAPTNDRSVVGVMNEFAFHGELLRKDGLQDLEALSLRLAGRPLGPLHHRTGFPDRELAAIVGGSERLATVIAFSGPPARAEPAPRASAKSGSVYQLKVTLLDTKPPIWRRVLVDGRSTLDHLHEVIQAAFGWWNCHLHEFEVGTTRYGVPDPDGDWDPPRDERRTRLDAIAGKGTSLRYTYDFGDGWDHRVVVEKVLPPAAVTAVPACIDGRRACPPEDCGGTWGYRELLAILGDRSHPEHHERWKWLGRRDFDPEAFDPSEFEENLRNGRLATFDDGL
ncbi:MAG TPA: plasmid pRiA4b ORF-3 family protein [Acidimicrobiales bacterium]|nr:plasmid pRiA4b ORF-3 family protein [Acidimicrobiales bacterium]